MAIVPKLIPARPGIYAPIPSFFLAGSGDLDIPTHEKHCLRLARAGLVGLVVAGSMGEAAHISPAERQELIQSARHALDSEGYVDTTVIAGCSDQSVRGTIALCEDAAKAGASYALVLPPSYYTKPVNGAASHESVEQYFIEVARQSPIPVMIYNYPAVAGGWDLDSDALVRIARAASNIAGVKFTCGNTGKLGRVALAMGAAGAEDAAFQAGPPGSTQETPFLCFAGMADFLLPAAVNGGSGTIAGGANVFPRVCVRIWKKWADGNMVEAMELQQAANKGDWALTKVGVAGTKAALEIMAGYGGEGRAPLGKVGQEVREMLSKEMKEVMTFEEQFENFPGGAL